MKGQKKTSIPLPPRLSMDEYADYVEASLGERDPRDVARQKALEERIRSRFKFTVNE